MKIPKAIIPVHTCELGGHQSISHTSQQNRVPQEPINLLCNPLNGCIYGASRFQKGAQKGDVEQGAGKRGALARLPGRRKEKRVYAIAPATGPFGALKYPNEESELPQKAFVFRGRAARAHSTLPSRPGPPAAPLLTQSQTQAEAPGAEAQGNRRHSQ